MKEIENKFTKGQIYRLEYLSRMGRFHYHNVEFVRYVGPFYFEGCYSWDDNSIPCGNYWFRNEKDEPTQVVEWQVNEKTQEVEAFGKWERNFLRQDHNLGHGLAL